MVIPPLIPLRPQSEGKTAVKAMPWPVRYAQP
jgi:hypothetical protein